MIIQSPGYNAFGDLNAFDGPWDALKKLGRKIDPTARGSLTYDTAAKLVGEKNLVTAAEIGRTARDVALTATAKAPGVSVPLGPDGKPLYQEATIFGLDPMLAMGAAAVALFVLSRRR